MKVRIVQPDPESVSGTKVLFEDGREVPFVRAVTWRHEAGELPVADVELAFVAAEDIAGRLRAYVGGRQVRRIEFVDGSDETFAEDELIEVTHMNSASREFVKR